MITVSDLYIYPLKSGAAVSLVTCEITATGLANDRRLAVIDADNKILTGREYPKLLGVQAAVTGQVLHLREKSNKEIDITISAENNELLDIMLFKNLVQGIDLGSAAAAWVSNLLSTNCRLVAMLEHHRPLREKDGGQSGDKVNYADTSPILLLSEESLADLNQRLDSPVTMQHFRPNIVVKGCLPYEEDTWQTVEINGCLFDVHLHCPRCVFITIDPVTQQKDPNAEPLATLAKYRKQTNNAVTFGVYLVPRRLGCVKIGDSVKST
ncbi:MOSC domain-containing protein [Reichenbachiella agarivorans]|uniref:MOSC domain-containing protein n=1 Tax=Reichenbachiella agarivorans TaxID=2979464 RepID=A0ABY6CMA1_9BACT|nr:MOSC N-terminal beta barrel domain-containing protein [Reichenbachiella agarivorans]UXP31602.1 MOSC domain-containing protein [Reichenbachiella agarivorans]